MTFLEAAINGARSPADHSGLPVTPAEQARTAAACQDQGADAVHAHVRDDQGRETLVADAVGALMRAVRVAAPALPVGVSTGAWIVPDPGARAGHVRRWRERPDFASVNFDELGAADLAGVLLALGVGVEAGLASPAAAEAFVASGLAPRCLRVLLEPQEETVPEALATSASIEQGRNGMHRSRRMPSVRVLMVVGGLSCLLGPAALAAQQPDRARQIAAAVLPLPAELRAAAGVVALDGRGQPRVWRPSANGMICLADSPGDSVFDVRCYQAGFVPVIYRIRQLIAQGVADSALEGTIEAEIRSGKLPITKAPTAGYRMYGPVAGYDPTRNVVSDRIDAWQSIHMPYRTAASMGLSTTEDGIHPYVMASGTYWAHVMIMQRPLRY